MILTVLITIMLTFGCINNNEQNKNNLTDNVSLEYNDDENKLLYSITLDAPRSCDSFEVVETNILESYPAQVIIKLKPVEADMVCATVITPVTIDGEIEIDHNPQSVTIKLEDETIFQSEEGALLEKNYCTKEQKQADICTMEYNPVCGNNEQTYSNPCVACSSNEIEYYTEGEC